mmetsp:Transcript_10634/g.30261  ORF Transcript_10634/g.30261 Transcript_10634/m.30261 type:complete len:408 (+) Transcript_10634:417-1640(+)
MYILSIDPVALEPSSTSVTIAVRGAAIPEAVQLTIRDTGVPVEMCITSHVVRPDGITLLQARLPNTLSSGFKWIEAFPRGEPVLQTDPRPLLVTAHSGLGEQISSALSARSPHFAKTVAFLQGVSDALYPNLGEGPYFDPSVLLESVCLATPQVVEEMVYAAWDWFDNGEGDMRHSEGVKRLLIAADGLGRGLLITALQTDCDDTVMMVIDILEEAGMPVDIFRQVDETGLTALHCAAMMSSPEVLHMIMLGSQRTLYHWENSRATLAMVTPAEIMQARNIPFAPHSPLEYSKDSKTLLSYSVSQGSIRSGHDFYREEDSGPGYESKPSTSSCVDRRSPFHPHMTTLSSRMAIHAAMVLCFVIILMLLNGSRLQPLAAVGASFHVLHILMTGLRIVLDTAWTGNKGL